MTRDLRALAVLGGLFVLFLTVFNRGFVYLHLDLGGRPLFVTEPFLAATSLLIAAGPSTRAFFRGNDRAIVAAQALVGIFLALVAVKMVIGVPRFGLEAVRQAALGYYSLAVLIAFAMFRNPVIRGRIFRLIAIGSAVSTVLLLIDAAGWNQGGFILLREFHGFGAFIWLGIVAAYLLATGRVDLGASPGSAALFALHAAVGFTLAGRSEFLGLALALGSVFVLRFRLMARRERASVGLAGLIVVAFFALRLTDVVTFRSQDTWKQAWASYRVGATALHRAATGVVTEPSAPGETAVPQDAIVFDPTSGTLRSESLASLNNGKGGDGNTASVNNAIWRKELWRLSVKAVMRNAPAFGMPLGTTLHFYMFGRLVPGRVDLHNSHLAVLYRFGLAGFLLYAAIVLTSMSVFGRGVGRREGRPVFYLAALLYLAVLASFNVMLEGPYGALVFWGLLGAGLADNDLIHQPKERL